MYNQAGASEGADAYDAEKLFNNITETPAIYTGTFENAVTVSAVPALTGSRIVALGVIAPSAGTYSLKASEVTNFPANTQVELEDRELNKMISFSEGTEYTFNTEGHSANRFYVHFNKNAAQSAGAASANIFAADGKVAVSFSSIDVAAGARIVVANTLGQVVKTFTNTTEAALIRFDLDQPEGVYVVRVTGNGVSSTGKVFHQVR